MSFTTLLGELGLMDSKFCPNACLCCCSMQEKTLRMGQHCTNEGASHLPSLESLSSDPENPRYFEPLPLPPALPLSGRDNASLSLPNLHGGQNLLAHESSGRQLDVNDSARHHSRQGPQQGQQDLQYSLGSEPRIGRRAARRYRVGVAEWHQQAQRRWGLP